MNQETAILFFSRTAQDEANAKVLVKKTDKNKRVAEHLINHSLFIAKQTGIPVYTSKSNEQIGKSFKEKLANALELVYKKGVKQVIIIGNDCPSLTTKDLLKTKTQLEKNELVLGPSKDGGVYLIGINQSAYKRKDFLKLNWLQSSLQNSWREYALRHNQIVLWLKALSDIDSIIDFELFVKSSYSKLAILLKQFIYSKLNLPTPSFIANSILLSRFHSDKSPPVISL